MDAGTINPIEHGDPYLCEDGTEADMDIGSYEKFLGEDMGRDNFVTMGQIYHTVIERERRFEYKGEDVEDVKQEITDKKTSSGLPKTYTVTEGDDLWNISEKLYKSGYSWVDIAKANNLANPSVIHAGVKLTIPDVKPKIIATEKQEKVSEVQSANAIKGDSYTVVSGDNLWNIAVRAYGDGFRYVEIAKTNNVTNPDLIFSGNKLTIPR